MSTITDYLDRLNSRLSTVERKVINSVAGDTSLIDNAGITQFLISTFNQPTAPVGLNQSSDVGSDWINSTTGVVQWWDGIAWQAGFSPYTNRSDLGALGPAVIVRARTFLLVTTAAVAPGAPAVPDIWFDTGASTYKQWQGASWVAITDANIISALGSQVTTTSCRVNFSSAAPGTHNEADIWWDTDNWSEFIWRTSAWIPLVNTGIGTTLGDGILPAFSPAPSALAGIKSVFLTWSAVPNGDIVNYDVYGNTTNVATTDAAHYLGTTQGTIFTVAKVPSVLGGGALGTTVLYYYIVARDADGSAAVGAIVGPVTPLLVNTPDIAVGAITAGVIAAGTITATQIAASTITGTQLSATAIDGKTITGALIRTAASGSRIELENFGGGAHLKFVGDGTEAFPGDILVSGSSGGGIVQIDGFASTPTTGALAIAMNTYIPGVNGVPSSPTDTCDISLVADHIYLRSQTGVHAEFGFDVQGPISATTGITAGGNVVSSQRLSGNSCEVLGINFTSSAANLFIGSGGLLAKSSSLSRLKLDQKPLDMDEVRGLLLVTPKTWYDRTEVEENDGKTKGLKRIPGVIAEDVDKHAPTFATYGAEGELEGVAYDRIGVAALMLVKELSERIERLEQAAR